MTTKKYDEKTEKPLNAVIDLKVFKEFDRQRRQRSQIKKDAVTAALRIWIELPAEIQAVCIEEKPDSPLTFVKERLLDLDTLKAMEGMSFEERLNVLRKLNKVLK